MSTSVSENSPLAQASGDVDLINQIAAFERRERRILTAMRVGGIILIVLIWEGLVRGGYARELLFGQPSRIIAFLMDAFTGGELFTHTIVTGFETLLGYIMGVGLGCATGFAVWWMPRLGKVIDPYMIALNSIPKVALAPLFLVWFGLGIATKVVLSFSTVFLVMHLITYSSLRQVEQGLVDLATSFGATRQQTFFKIVVPSTLPWILSSMKVCIGFALTGAVIGEYVAANKGLGYLTLYAAQLYEMSLVWAAIFMLVVLSICLYACISWLQRRLMPWQDK